MQIADCAERICSPVGFAIWAYFTRRGNSGFPLLIVIFGGGVIATFVCLISLVLFMRRDAWQRGKAQAQALDERGQVCDGVIIDRWTNHGDYNRSDYFHRYVAYRYGAYEIRQLVRAWTYWPLKVGTPVQVRYLPDNPLVARLENDR